jgi:hypothetical protein
MHEALDDRGEICKIMFTAAIRDNQFTDGQPAVKTYITLPCGDTYAFWAPIFTEWF